jgi:hypothetical protein
VEQKSEVDGSMAGSWHGCFRVESLRSIGFVSPSRIERGVSKPFLTLGVLIMRKLALAGLALLLSFGLALASEVSFVKFDKDKKELTVKEDEKNATYKITDDTKVKRGEKEGKLENLLKYFDTKAKEGDTFDITVDKDKKTITEIKLKDKK